MAKVQAFYSLVLFYVPSSHASLPPPSPCCPRKNNQGLGRVILSKKIKLLFLMIWCAKMIKTLKIILIYFELKKYFKNTELQ